MKNLLKKSALAAVAAISFLGSAPAVYADDYVDPKNQPLVFSFRTKVYQYQGPSNSITIYLGSVPEYGTDGQILYNKTTEFYVHTPVVNTYVDVKPYTVVQGSGGYEVSATAIPCTVTAADDRIEVYGDASKIDYIDIHGCYVYDVQLSEALTGLSVVDFSHNELEKIDLSKFSTLNSIDLLDNAFTVNENMVIGDNHPHLEILSIGINDACDPNLNISNYPFLTYFSARNNLGITKVDPTGCPRLVSLVLEVTNITSLDVTQNKNLDVLNITQTRIKEIDLSQNTLLGEFYWSHEGSYNSGQDCKIDKVDLTHCPNLEYLDLGGNNLTELDVTKCPKLIMLYAMRNKLSSIDLSQNTKLSVLDLSYNRFTFATLPLPKPEWSSYYYNFLPLECNYKYKTNDVIDFGPSVIHPSYQVDGQNVTPTTYATVFREPRGEYATELTSGYTYDTKTGKLTFTEAFSDSLYVSFYCTSYPEARMSTTRFMVKTPEEYDLPSKVVSFTTKSNMAGKSVSFKIGGTAVAGGVTGNPDVFVTFNGANQQKFEKVVTSSSMPESNNVTFTLPASGATQVNVFMTDGFGLTAFGMDGVKLSTVDVSMSEDLRTLEITNAELTTIDTRFNNSLRSLNLSHNEIVTLDLKAVRGDYMKWYLSDIDVSYNYLKNIAHDDWSYIRNLNMSHNEPDNFDFRYYVNLRTLDISDCMLTGVLDLSKVERLENLYVQNNSLSYIDLPTWQYIKNLNLSKRRWFRHFRSP